MGFRLEGFDDMLRSLRGQPDRVRDITPMELERSALLVESTAKKLLSLTSHAPGTRTPSGPGSPPSLVTGSLRRSITTVALGGEVLVGPTIVYGRIQELGGVAGRGAKLPPRPYMAPALAEATPKIAERMREVWARALAE